MPKNKGADRRREAIPTSALVDRSPTNARMNSNELAYDGDTPNGFHTSVPLGRRGWRHRLG
jgi:hypothetical protein